MDILQSFTGFLGSGNDLDLDTPVCNNRLLKGLGTGSAAKSTSCSVADLGSGNLIRKQAPVLETPMTFSGPLGYLHTHDSHTFTQDYKHTPLKQNKSTKQISKEVTKKTDMNIMIIFYFFVYCGLKE